MTEPETPSPAPVAAPADLAATFRKPTRYAWFEGIGARVRHAVWTAPGRPRGTVVLLTGRGEFIEKYAMEVVGELLDRGFAVFALDWRGQGLSDRPLPEHDKGHIDNFSTYLGDLKLFLETVVGPAAPRPMLLLCHSMGGHLALRHLAEERAGPFSAAVMTAPMTVLQREALLRSVLWLMPELPAVEERYLFGTGPFVALADDFKSNHVTHDERRYRFTGDWFRADPRLELGGPTIGWCRQATRSMSLVQQPGYLEQIDVPVLVMTAGQDQLIDPASHAPLVARLRQGEHVVIAESAHEIMMELDPIRAQFWDAFDKLVARTLR
ncbi:MAG TPA: alpha/beta hydrolase [Reyranella sp.]|nr:alpha/beta hydrolase [Reyranella sp.]